MELTEGKNGYFLCRMGLIKYYGHSGYIASVLEEDELMSVRANAAVIFRRLKGPNDTIRMGKVMAEIIDPYEGDITMQIVAPTDGIVFFAHNEPLVLENTVVFKVIRRLHK